MTRLTPENFDQSQRGRAHVLFGDASPETARMAGVLKGSDVPWYLVDINSSGGAQVTMRVGVRVAPAVYVYEDGLVLETFSAAQLTGPEALNV